MDQQPELRLDIFTVPQEVLEAIFLYLQPRSFLHFCAITKHFWQNQHRNATYWRVKTSNTFRVPLSPLLHTEGDRWCWLFKKLQTQVKAFSWGQGRNGELGLPGERRPIPAPRRQPAELPGGCSLISNRINQSWPFKMDIPEEVGVIADLQCGGWSTTLLNSRGCLFSVGVLDNDVFCRPTPRLAQLTYPSNSPIRSFSAGRRHVLGLDEEGYVWSWDCIDRPAFQILEDFPIKALRVVAGWSVSSASTREGIIYWRSGRYGHDYAAASSSTDDSGNHLNALVKTKVVPGTDGHSQKGNWDGTPAVGDVLGHIVLEAYIVFVTTEAKVLACRIVGEDQPAEPPFELPAFSASGRQLKDIQGSFRSFSVFTGTGEVWSGNQDYLDQLYDLRLVPQPVADGDIMVLRPEAKAIRRPDDIAALQHSGVISMAYGDHHSHALHLDGHISSYGREAQHRGAFGLSTMSRGGRFRAVKSRRQNFGADCELLPIAYRTGREVWFSDSQKAWLHHLEVSLARSAYDNRDHTALPVLENDRSRQAAYSEWVEREGKAWEEGIDDDGDGLRSHFAISVAAAGWHSAALVLENPERAAKVREKWTDEAGDYVWENAEFPRIKFPDGYEIPGPGDLHDWKGGIPAPGELDG